MRKFDPIMKHIIICFFLLTAGLSSYSQVSSILLDAKDQITKDSTQATTYAVYGKLTGDSVYTFKKFSFDGVMLTTGSFKDEKLQVPDGKFVYYNWITPNNNTVNYTNEINGRERYIELAGSFTNGRRNGRWISFYPTGKIKQVITYYQGVIHGPYQFFDEDGKISVQGLYNAGKKNGTWILNGGKQENVYANDVLVSSLKGKKLRDKQMAGKNTN